MFWGWEFSIFKVLEHIIYKHKTYTCMIENGAKETKTDTHMAKQTFFFFQSSLPSITLSNKIFVLDVDFLNEWMNWYMHTMRFLWAILRYEYVGLRKPYQKSWPSYHHLHTRKLLTRERMILHHSKEKLYITYHNCPICWNIILILLWFDFIYSKDRHRKKMTFILHYARSSNTGLQKQSP